MFSADFWLALRKGLFCCSIFAGAFAAGGAELSAEVKGTPKVAEASKEGEEMMRSFKLPAGFKAEVVAAEPLLANIVAFTFDEKGQLYVSETFRLHAGVGDIRGVMSWLDEDLASRSPDERLAMMKRHMGEKWSDWAKNSDRVKLLTDRDGDGKYDASTVFADGFSHALDGLASGVLARQGDVWFANIPNLWFLRDENGDGKADVRKSLHYGYGVRLGFLGHDLHGLTFGPDGRIYYSIGDRGAQVKIDGKVIGDADCGSVFRCFPDGSGLEVFHSGLRNPQELAFDDHGNLFTGDNNSDGGDRARWVYLVEGGDSGWRVGYQHLNEPVSRGPWNAEKMWHPHWEGQAAYILPPITNVTAGPSGLAYYPGTGLPDSYKGHFFLVDFRGQRSSGIHSFATKENGATFDLADREDFVWDALPTDVDFGPDGGVYFSDWVQGWGMTGKGRLYRVYNPETASNPVVAETKRLLREGMEKRSARELVRLLGHDDKRVRQEAQFQLADGRAVKELSEAARKGEGLARLHGIWGLWQLGMRGEKVANALLPLFTDKDSEVRAQAARVAGDLRLREAYAGFATMLNDEAPRARFFAANGLGRLGRSDAIPALLKFAGEARNKEPYLRHAAVMGLVGSNDVEAVIAASKNESAQTRMAVLLALRRLERAEIAAFLKDSDPLIVTEAARAINDVPISGAMKELAELADKTHEDAAPELARRVVNANLRFGTESSAKTLAAIAKNDGAPDAIRVAALEALGNWEHPSGRDAITGLWRPAVGRRESKHAQEALRPVIASSLSTGPDAVRAAAAKAVGRVKLQEASANLADLVTKPSGAGRIRVEALRSLAEIDLEKLAVALPAAQKDESEDVRREALRLAHFVKSSDPTVPLVAALQNGSIGEKQAALAALGELDAGEKILGEQLDRVIRGEEPKEIHLDIVQAAAKRPGLKERVDKWAASFPAEDTLKDLRLAMHGGNAEAGKKIFFERADVSCARCHKVAGQGGEVGPDLTGIGARQTREYILESISHPNKVIAKGFDNVMVWTKDGTAAAGILKSETDTELVLNSPEDGIVTLKKSEIARRAVGASGMPEGLAVALGPKDLRDLIEYLAAQK